MLKVFINNQWVEYSYEYLYTNFGYTDTPSKDIKVYNDSLQLLEAWENSEFVWIQQDTQWYPIQNLPYYIITNRNLKLYKIDAPQTFKIYIKQQEEFVSYNDSFVPSNTLHENYGYTDTPSTVWDIDEGVPWSWYNEDLDQYWDDRVGKKYWSDIPPEPEQEDEGGVPTYPDPFIPLQQWEEDLSQIPTIWSRSGKYFPPQEIPQIYKAFKNWDTWEDYQNLFNLNDRFYPDKKEYDVKFYVYPEEGADDWGGVHHNQGDIFIGDQQFVWVESDADIDFYHGTQKFTFAQTHDDNYLELFYIDPNFYTSTEMHNLGYTRTQGQNVEIWDMNLVGRHLWVDDMWLYTTPSTIGLGANIPIMDGSGIPTKAYFTITIENYTFSGIAKNAGKSGNDLNVKMGYNDYDHKFTVFIYDHDVLAYSKTTNTFSDLDDNTLIDFSGSFLSSLVPNRTLSIQLSGGSDDSAGVPIYYDNGTPVVLNDYIGQRILQTKQIKINSIDGFLNNHYETRNMVESGEDFYFSVGENDTVLLRKVSGNNLNNIIGFSFDWDTNGSIIHVGNVIGLTRRLQSSTSTLYSKYYWVYSFNSIGSNGTNWWDPSYYQNVNPPRTVSSLQPVPGSEYAEVVMTTDSDGTHIPTQFNLASYNSKPEIYFDAFSFDSAYKEKSGVIIKFGSAYTGSTRFSLPTDLYTINGLEITWNINHPLYKVFFGKEFEV